jgi:hypothetical protein
MTENLKPDTPIDFNPATEVVLPTTTAGAHDGAVIEALAEMGRGLDALFRHGRELCSQPDDTGIGYLIAHAGRELIFGVVAELEEEKAATSKESLEPTSSLREDIERSAADSLTLEKTDQRVQDMTSAVLAVLRDRTAVGAEELAETAKKDYRLRIASALQLSPNDSVVKRWVEVARQFQRAAHQRTPPPPTGPARRAFGELSELLYGLVGPIFETEADLDVLARVQIPNAADVEKVRQLVPRAVQRRHFFRRLESPGWIERLSSAGLFRHPPEREVFGDGSWRIRPWPEGEYLLRMVPKAPQQVAEILLDVPSAIENPAVWAVVADAVTALPTSIGPSLVPKLVSALETAPSVFFPHRAVEAAKHLSAEGAKEVFPLSKALLAVRTPPEVPPRSASESPEDYLVRLKEARGKFIYKDGWVLKRIEQFDFEQFLSSIVPNLESIDSGRTLKFLAHRLVEADQLVIDTRKQFAEAIRQTEQEQLVGKSDPIPGSDEEIVLAMERAAGPQIEPGATRYWCERLDVADDRDDVRSHLAVAVFATARRMTVGGEAADNVILMLDKFSGEIFRRMELLVMADELHLSPDVTERLDALLQSETALWPPFGAREIAPLLRAHFSSASQVAQSSYLRALEAGPGQEQVDWIIEFFERPDTPEERRQIVGEWQRSRLRWFHDHIPRLLQPLADALGVSPEVPSFHQQSLDEIGSSHGGVFSRSLESPITQDELGALAPDVLAQYLSTWRPSSGAAEDFEEPCTAGLESAMTTLLSEEPGRIEELATPLVSRQIPLGYASAVLRGMRTALGQEKNVPVASSLRFARYAWQESESASDQQAQQSDNPAETGQPLWTCIAACHFVTALLQADEVKQSEIEGIWSLAAQMVGARVTWQDNESPPATFAEARNRSSTSLSARVTEMVVALAWRDFVLAHGDKPWPPSAQPTAVPRLIPLLAKIMARDGVSALSARGAIGGKIPQLLIVVRDWTNTNLDELFQGGASSPAEKPAWGMYLSNSRIMSSTFTTLRAFYAEAAAALPEDGTPLAQDKEWLIAKALSGHVVTAAVNGFCAPGDSDHVLENTFSRVPVDDRTHAYWMVYRGWSDSKAQAVEPLSPHVIAFWESRLSALESAKKTEQIDEEADGLCWFIATPHLPTDEVIRLGQRTAKLIGKKNRTTSLTWKRLTELVEMDPVGAFPIAARFIELGLASDYVYLPFDDVAPSLRVAIRAGGALRKSARLLVDKLGAADLYEYRELWTSEEDEIAAVTH